MWTIRVVLEPTSAWQLFSAWHNLNFIKTINNLCCIWVINCWIWKFKPRTTFLHVATIAIKKIKNQTTYLMIEMTFSISELEKLTLEMLLDLMLNVCRCPLYIKLWLSCLCKFWMWSMFTVPLNWLLSRLLQNNNILNVKCNV
jgi:hypothetical protein